MSSSSDTPEVQRLQAQVRALEQLLAVHEQAVIEESSHREAAEAERTKLLEQLKGAIEELSTPILEVWDDIIALPVIGVIDSQRAALMMERLLVHIVSSKSRVVILDLTGVQIVDTAVADHFVRMMKATELLGATCIITGIQPAVAQTLVGIGVNLGSMKTLRSLRHALRETVRG